MVAPATMSVEHLSKAIDEHSAEAWRLQDALTEAMPLVRWGVRRYVLADFIGTERWEPIHPLPISELEWHRITVRLTVEDRPLELNIRLSREMMRDAAGSVIGYICSRTCHEIAEAIAKWRPNQAPEPREV